MAMQMEKIANATEEMEYSKDFNIRFIDTKNRATLTTNDFQDVLIDIPWTDATNTELFKYWQTIISFDDTFTNDELFRNMPALCYLFARNLQVLMMKEGLVATPIGLISSEWGGTPIQSWTPNREALKRLIMISKL